MSERSSGEAQSLYSVEVLLVPGGKLPERKTDRSIGHDMFARAIVAPKQEGKNGFDELFDFKMLPSSASSQAHIEPIFNNGEWQWAWRLDPGERVLVGVGVALGLPNRPEGRESFGMVTPRSGLAYRHGISIENTPGIVDADYRAELAPALTNHGDQPFLITHQARIAQIIFAEAYLPTINIVDENRELPATDRGFGGYGSTGS